MSLPVLSIREPCDELQQVSRHVIECYRAMEARGVLVAATEQHRHQPDKISLADNGYFQRVVERPVCELSSQTSWSDVEVRVELIVRDRQWLKIAQRQIMEDVAQSVATSTFRRRMSLASSSLPQVGRSPAVDGGKEPEDDEVVIKSNSIEGGGKHSIVQSSKLIISRGVMVHVWRDPRSARNFVNLWSRVWQAIFEHRIVGIHCPFSAMFCIQGEYVSVTALPPVTMAGVHASGKVDGFLSYMITRLAVALALPTENLSLSLLAGVDGRHYVASIESLLVGSAFISGFEGLIARTELVLCAAFAPQAQQQNEKPEEGALVEKQSSNRGSFGASGVVDRKGSSNRSSIDLGTPLLQLDSSSSLLPGAAPLTIVPMIPMAYLKDRAVPALVDELINTMARRNQRQRQDITTLISGHALRNCFHKHGVNMSLLYYVTKQVGVHAASRAGGQGVEELLRWMRTEMVGRVLKELIRQDFATRVKTKADRLMTLGILQKLLWEHNQQFWEGNVLEGVRYKYSAPKDFTFAMQTVSFSGALLIVTTKLGAVITARQSPLEGSARSFAGSGRGSMNPQQELTMNSPPSMDTSLSTNSSTPRGEFTNFASCTETRFAFVAAQQAAIGQYAPEGLAVGHHSITNPDAVARRALQIAQACQPMSLMFHTFLVRAYVVAVMLRSDAVVESALSSIRQNLLKLQEYECNKNAHPSGGSGGGSGSVTPRESSIFASGSTGEYSLTRNLSKASSSLDEPPGASSPNHISTAELQLQSSTAASSSPNPAPPRKPATVKHKTRRAVCKFESPFIFAIEFEKDHDEAGSNNFVEIMALAESSFSFPGNYACIGMMLLRVAHSALLQHADQFAAAFTSALRVMDDKASWVDLYACDASEGVLRLMEESLPSMTSEQASEAAKIISEVYTMHSSPARNRRATVGIPYAARALRALVMSTKSCELGATLTFADRLIRDSLEELGPESELTIGFYYCYAASASAAAKDASRMLGAQRLIVRADTAPLLLGDGVPACLSIARSAPTNQLMLNVQRELTRRGAAGPAGVVHQFVLTYGKWYCALLAIQTVGRGYLDRSLIRRWQLVLQHRREAAAGDAERKLAALVAYLNSADPDRVPEAPGLLAKYNTAQKLQQLALIFSEKYGGDSADILTRVLLSSATYAARANPVVGGKAAPAYAADFLRMYISDVGTEMTVGGVHSSRGQSDDELSKKQPSSTVQFVSSAAAAGGGGGANTASTDANLEEIVKRVFLLCDRDGDGLVTANACFSMIEEMKIMRVDELRSMFVAKHGGRLINFLQFKEMVLFGTIPDGIVGGNDLSPAYYGKDSALLPPLAYPKKAPRAQKLPLLRQTKPR